MDDFQKHIYNTYLKTIAEQSGRPYTKRKNFDKIDGEIQHALLKLSTFFNKYKHIDIDMFMIAPYKIWKDSQFHPLEFYTKRKALNCYLNYKKQLLNLPPDDKYHLNRVLAGLSYIKEFSQRENIKPLDYIYHKSPTYVFLEHLKYDKISIYNLFAYEGFKSLFRDEIDAEVKTLLFESYYEDYDIMYRKYNNSEKCRVLSKKGLQKINSMVI